MNRKSLQDRAKIIQLLCEGNSMRGTSRIMDCSINTVTKLLEETGARCLEIQDRLLVDLPCKRIQVDEMWSFCYAKKQNLPDGKDGGDLWTFTAICPDTKIIPCFRVGPREAEVAVDFLQEVADRVEGKFQLSTDGWSAYRNAVDGLDVDFGRIVKQYAKPMGKRFGGYNGQVKEAFSGDPDPAHIQTVHVERANLTMRMSVRRLARKTNAHSKKEENHKLALAMFFAFYNFCRIHKTLRVTPAMAAGVTDKVWGIEDLISV